MSNPTVKDTTMPIILYYVRQKLIKDGVYGQSTVYLGVEPSKVAGPLPPSTVYCVIRPLQQKVTNNEIVVTPAIIGSQRATPTMEGELEVACWQKLSVDLADRLTIQLTNQNLGLYMLANKVVLSLQLYNPIDATNYIMVQPMRLVGSSELIESQGWISIKQRYNIRYGFDPQAYSPIVGQVGEYDWEYDYEYNSVLNYPG